MTYEVGQDIKIINPSKEVMDFVFNELKVDNPEYATAQRLGRYVGNKNKYLDLYVLNGNNIIVPFGCINKLWKCGLLNNAEYKLNFHEFIGSNLKGTITLFDYQNEALEKLYKGKNGVLEAPCGSGKTQIGLALIKKIGGRALRLTHTKKLLEQSKKRAEAYFQGDFGTITEGSVRIGKDITFATVQTMRMIDTNIYKDAFDIVIVDECHHCVGTPTNVMQFYKVITNCNCRYKYGLSATLDRKDGLSKSMFSLLGEKLYTITKEQVGNKIIKANHIRIDIHLNYELLDYCDSDGTINYVKMITMLGNDERRNEIIVSKAFEYYLKGKKQLILCDRISQIKYLSERIAWFCEVNCLTSKVKQKNRSLNGDVIIATYSLASEGLDIPNLDVVHFASPKKDKTAITQCAGRVERNYENKPQPIVLDYVDMNIRYCVNCFKIREKILK